MIRRASSAADHRFEDLRNDAASGARSGSSEERRRRRSVLVGPAEERSSSAAPASSPASPGVTNRPAAEPSSPRNSWGPPAAVATTGTPDVRASLTTRPKSSGWVEGSTKTSRSASSSATSLRCPSQWTPGMPAARFSSSSAWSSLPGTVGPAMAT